MPPARRHGPTALSRDSAWCGLSWSGFSWDLKGYNLDTDTRFVVNTGGSNDMCDIDGDVVVWRDGSDIYTRDL